MANDLIDISNVMMDLQRENDALRSAARSIAILVLYAQATGGMTEVMYREFFSRISEMARI